MENKSYLQQSSKIFDSSEKWTAFIELYKLKDQLKNLWFQELQNSVKIKINTEIDTNNKWTFKTWTPNSYGWYMDSYGENSLVILYENNHCCLYTESINKLSLIIDKYMETSLFNSYFEKAEKNKTSKYLAKKQNAITINGQNDIDLIAWYACKEHSDHQLFVDEICKFFGHFISDPIISEIIEEFNKELVK